MKINITNCYCLFLFNTIMVIVILNLSMSRIELLNDRCDYLENKIETQKNEVVSTDYQSAIQLHR